MKKSVSLCFFAFVLIMFFTPIVNAETLSLPSDLIKAISCKTIDEVAELVLSISTNPNDLSYEKKTLSDGKQVSIYMDDVVLSSHTYNRIYGTMTEKYFNYKFSSSRPFGETIETSQDFIDTVNECTQLYGPSIRTKRTALYNAEENKRAIAWYVDELDITITVAYLYGDVSELKFPEMEIILDSGNLETDKIFE